MSDHEMSDVERRAMEAANRVYKDLLAKYFTPVPNVVISPAGTRIHLKGKASHSYRYYESDDGWRFAYTPWKDENGDYFYWTYKPVGRGARSGDPTKWKAINIVSTRKRKTAKEWAYRRYQKRKEKIAKRTGGA